MIGYVTLGSDNLERARAFYDELNARHQPDATLEARKEMLARAVAERSDPNGFGASLWRDLEKLLTAEIHQRDPRRDEERREREVGAQRL